MTGQKFSKSDRTVFLKSACHTCQNKSNCRNIASSLTTIEGKLTEPDLSPPLRKKFASVAEHLRREGFSFPNVRHPSMCWMHQKFGVATFYENQLVQLAEKMNHTGNELPPASSATRM